MSHLPQLTSLTVTGINGKNTGATLIGTTNNGTQLFHPLIAVCKASGASTVTIPAALSVGTNGASYNNVLPITTLTGITAANQMLPTNLAGAVGVIAANTGVYANVTTGATATSLTLEVHLIGYYF